MNQIDKNSKRLTDLESTLMHLQNDYDSLNEVVLELSQKMDGLSKMFERLTERFEASSSSETPRSAEDEKPPHY